MIAEALLRARPRARQRVDYLRWYAPHQFANGKVPCCVDARGADPVAGERQPRRVHLPRRRGLPLHAAIARCSRAMWPHVAAAVRYIDSLRAASARRRLRRRTTRCSAACCPRRSATKAIRPSRCIRTGTTSGRCKGYASASMLAARARHARRGAQLARARATSSVATSSRSLARRARRARHRLPAGLRRARRLRSDVDDDRASRRAASSSAAAAGSAARDIRALLARVRRAPRRRKRLGRLHAVRAAQRRRVRAPRLARARARAARPSSSRAAARRRGTSGPRSSAATRGSRASSATCRTAGSHPTTFARCSTSSPTSAMPRSDRARPRGMPAVVARTGAASRCATCARPTGHCRYASAERARAARR